MRIFFCILASLLFLQADNETYVIEANGEFGKELQELVKKHANENNVSVNTYKKQGEEKSDSFISVGINKNQKFSIEKGLIAYENNCKSCHGEKGNTRAMGVSRKLSELSAEEIESQVRAYAIDAEYGERTRFVMQPFARKVSSKELGNIIAYLKGTESFKQDENENDDVQTKPTKQGTYLQ